MMNKLWWLEDSHCWEEWDGADGMAWTKGSNSGRGTMVGGIGAMTGTTGALNACFRVMVDLYEDTK
jgi:hypothetical protein